MKGTWLRICPEGTASRKRKSVATEPIIGMTFLTLVLLDGNVNSDVFDAGLTQELLLKIPSGAVVVMDNASFHPRYDMLEAIGAHQCMAVCLPRIANLR